jgi:hypothetical protein
MSEPFWTTDPAILFSPTTWQKFVPTKDMDISAALNSVVRFTTYFSILMYASTGRHQYVYAIPAVLVITFVFYKVFPNTRVLVETFSGKNVGILQKFTMPTSENPFMNPLLTEIRDDPDRPDAPPITSNTVKHEIEKAFQQTSDLYMDTTDKFDQSQAMRTFHTLQSAKIPNDQDGFLQFMAKGNDEIDTSSAPPARHAKADSETYVQAKGSMKSLPSTTTHPAGVTPTGPSATRPALN